MLFEFHIHYLVERVFKDYLIMILILLFKCHPQTDNFDNFQKCCFSAHRLYRITH